MNRARQRRHATGPRGLRSLAPGDGRDVPLMTRPCLAIRDTFSPLARRRKPPGLSRRRGGALGVLFETARGASLPTLVEASELVEANAKIAVTGSAGLIVGPGLGGLLIQLLTAPVAVAADALSFLVSALCLGAIRAGEPAPT